MNSSFPRIAIIGCGAVSEHFHLPALAALGIKPALLVDRNLQRVQHLAHAFEASRISDDYDLSVGEFDAAIVALPHHLHAPICTDLLRRGVHVLVEKPMALTMAECNAMIAGAEEGKAVLAVGLVRRFLHIVQWVKAALDAGVLGPVESVVFREGFVYNWPVASDFFFHRETAGGGVLMDTGAHTLDLLLWWLGDVASFEYYDDSYGGVEADCELYLTLATGAQGIVELSRTRNLPNTAVLRGRRGEIKVSLNSNHVIASPKEILAYSTGAMSGNHLPQQSFQNLFVLQIKDWLRAIKTGKMPLVAGVEGARSIALIEACYKQRRPLELPWVRPEGVQPDSSQVRTG